MAHAAGCHRRQAARRLDDAASVTVAALQVELTRLYESGRAAWPDIALTPGRFCEFLAPHLTSSRALGSLHAADLYLACACVDGDAAGLRAFEALLGEVGRKLRRLARDSEVLADAQQRVRQVLVRQGERAPVLADYSGRGALGGWLRIILGRELVRLGRREGRQPRLDTGEAALIVDGEDDPETAYLKRHYQREFKEAFTAAMRELAEQDRRALRYAIVERLSIDDIAKLEGVHRATAARDVARARARLTEETRRVLQQRLAIEAGQLDSILRLVGSEVDVSVRRLLGSG
jgi:RNA polymerase sigma-70 factor (ECF subfamily)